MPSSRVSRIRRVRRPLLALIALLAALGIGYGLRAADHTPAGPRSTSSTSSSASAPVSTPLTPLSSLPPQAAQTVRLIAQGGPFPYPHNDGVVFHNAEHRLPAERDGYYHEYTVPTPGSSTRGSRRIITGATGEYFYTGDHYESFVRVDVTR